MWFLSIGNVKWSQQKNAFVKTSNLFEFERLWYPRSLDPSLYLPLSHSLSLSISLSLSFRGNTKRTIAIIKARLDQWVKEKFKKILKKFVDKFTIDTVENQRR